MLRMAKNMLSLLGRKKMNKLILLLLLTSCGAKLTEENLNKVIARCAKNDGLNYVFVDDTGMGYIYCQDGAKFSTESIK